MMAKTKDSQRTESGTLGAYLKSLRNGVPMTLREVEEATNRDVSNAYLSQLENNRISKPSPNILHTLSTIYSAPYEKLMEKAGYITPGQNTGSSKHGRAATCSVDNLTPEEEKELLEYLAFYRSKRKRT